MLLLKPGLSQGTEGTLRLITHPLFRPQTSYMHIYNGTQTSCLSPSKSWIIHSLEAGLAKVLLRVEITPWAVINAMQINIHPILISVYQH